MDPLKMKISIQLIVLDLFTNLGALQRTDLCKNETGFQTSFDCHLYDKDSGAKIDFGYLFKYETTIKSLFKQLQYKTLKKSC